MRILSTIQAFLALVFLLFGVVALFSIDIIIGLMCLVPGAILAFTAAATKQASRGGVALALAADAVLACLAARSLARLLTPGMPGVQYPPSVGVLDYLIPAVALALVGVAVLGVAWNWRAVRNAPWF